MSGICFFFLFVQDNNWVLCRIFLKKRSAKNDNQEMATRGQAQAVNNCSKNSSGSRKKSGVVFYDFMAKDRTELRTVAPVSSSSGSSGITEVTSNESEEHEESSSCNSFITTLPVRRKP